MFEQMHAFPAFHSIRASRNAEELLDGLLDISRLGAGSFKPDPGAFRAARLCALLVVISLASVPMHCAAVDMNSPAPEQTAEVANREQARQANISEFWPGATGIASLVSAGDSGIRVEVAMGIAEQQMTGYFLPTSTEVSRASGWSAYLDSTRRVYVYVRADSPQERQLIAARTKKESVIVRGVAFGLVGKALSDKAGIVVEEIL